MKRLWNSSLVVKIFLSYFVVVALLFLSFYFSANVLLRHFYIRSLSTRMEQEAHLLARMVPFDQAGAALDSLSRQLSGELGARVTIIATDGRVLGDSAEISEHMENHATRPEILEAMRTGTGTSIRYSTTVKYSMLYRAFHQTGPDRDRFVRLAVPLTDIDNVIRAVRQSLVAGLVVASAVGLLLAWTFSRHLSRRFRRLVQFSGQVAAGSFPQNFFPDAGSDEIALLERHLNEMSLHLRANLSQIIEEKEKSDSILRCMIEGVLVLDPKGRVLVMNQQARGMFHVSDDLNVHGASVLEITRHPEVHRILEEILTFDFSTQTYSKEVELDDERWFRVNAVRLRDTRENLQGSILVFHDVTDIKRFESVRSDFVANVSHELRTPLTAIRGYVETLIHTPPADPKESRQFLAIIDRHSERLSRLTQDLLTLSDLESGKIQLSPQPLDAAHLIQRVLEVFWDQAARKQVKLTQRIEPELPNVLGDIDRLQQLFINLVDNALKYTPSGGEIILEARSLPPRNGTISHIELAVIDTGVGIPEKDLPRLTERFYRVDKARSREVGGTGLGLAIVKHIVQAHKGDLTIESVLNRGTTVRVRLTVAVVARNHPHTVLSL